MTKTETNELCLDLLHAMRPDVPRENFRAFVLGQLVQDYLHVDPDEFRRIVKWNNDRIQKRAEELQAMRRCAIVDDALEILQDEGWLGRAYERIEALKRTAQQ